MKTENYLIAEFMGLIDSEGNKNGVPKYDNWNDLMPVVEKVDQLGASVLIGRMFCDIKYIDPLNDQRSFEVRIASGVKFNAIKGALADFIIWYLHNEQQGG